MKLFLDTANVEEIREANDLGVICGVTTNPSLIAKEGRDFKEVVTEITSIVDGPISAEVISMDHEGMVREALELVKIHKNIVINPSYGKYGKHKPSVIFNIYLLRGVFVVEICKSSVTHILSLLAGI